MLVALLAIIPKEELEEHDLGARVTHNAQHLTRFGIKTPPVGPTARVFLPHSRECLVSPCYLSDRCVQKSQIPRKNGSR
jgi:hypothetical protein